MRPRTPALFAHSFPSVFSHRYPSRPIAHRHTAAAADSMTRGNESPVCGELGADVSAEAMLPVSSEPSSAPVAFDDAEPPEPLEESSVSGGSS